MALYQSGSTSPYTFERIRARDRGLPSQEEIRARFQTQPSPLSVSEGLGGSGQGRRLKPTYGGISDPTLGGGDGGGLEGSGAGLSDQEAAAQAQVSNASFAGEVVGGLPGIGKAETAVDAMVGALGPYGVTGLSQTPAVNTPAFDQATPTKDTPAGVPDAGAQAADASNRGLSPQAAFGGQASPVPDTFGQPKSVAQIGMRGLSNLGSSISSGLGLNDSDPASTMGVAGATPRGGGGGFSGSGPTGIGGIGNNTTGHSGVAPGGMNTGGRAGPTGGGGGDSGGGSTGGPSGGGHTGPDGPAGSGQGAF